jgi:Predicted transcriptional regulator with C-terminal CBS domains
MPAQLLSAARKASGLSQRRLAKKARTAQSVVARIELGETMPSWETLAGLLRSAGFELRVEARKIPVVDRQILDDVPRILRLTPEQRLQEVARVSDFIAGARRV